MMRLNIDLIKEKISPILEPCGIRRIGIFGSFARGQVHEGSDVDILVDFMTREIKVYLD